MSEAFVDPFVSSHAEPITVGRVSSEADLRGAPMLAIVSPGAGDLLPALLDREAGFCVALDEEWRGTGMEFPQHPRMVVASGTGHLGLLILAMIAPCPGADMFRPGGPRFIVQDDALPGVVVSIEGGEGYVERHGRRVWVSTDEDLPLDGYRLTFGDHVEVVIDTDTDYDRLQRVVERAVALLGVSMNEGGEPQIEVKEIGNRRWSWTARVGEHEISGKTSLGVHHAEDSASVALQCILDMLASEASCSPTT